MRYLKLVEAGSLYLHHIGGEEGNPAWERFVSSWHELDALRDQINEQMPSAWQLSRGFFTNASVFNARSNDVLECIPN